MRNRLVRIQVPAVVGRDEQRFGSHPIARLSSGNDRAVTPFALRDKQRLVGVPLGGFHLMRDLQHGDTLCGTFSAGRFVRLVEVLVMNEGPCDLARLLADVGHRFESARLAQVCPNFSE